MKSKKLLISLVVVAVVVVIIVVLAAVLTVKKVDIVFHDFDGSQIKAPDDLNGLQPKKILSDYKGKSIVFLSKSKLMTELNEKYPKWHAFAVVKNFPNEVEIHFVERTAVAKFYSGNEMVYVDCFGYITETPENVNVMDITSAFNSTEAADAKRAGIPFVFSSNESNNRLGYVLEAIRATWQCMVDVPDMVQTLGGEGVFTFDKDNSLVIKPHLKGKIVVQSPETNLSSRLIKAYSVYYNDQIDVQDDSFTVTVYKNGRITTPSK